MNRSETTYSDLIRDMQMAKLYEKLVSILFRKHLDSSIYYVYSPKLQWDLDMEVSDDDFSHLPKSIVKT